MQVAVSEFKSKCTKILRNVFNTGQVVEITRRGKVMAIVTPPGPDKKLIRKNFLVASAALFLTFRVGMNRSVRVNGRRASEIFTGHKHMDLDG